MWHRSPKLCQRVYRGLQQKCKSLELYFATPKPKVRHGFRVWPTGVFFSQCNKVLVALFAAAAAVSNAVAFVIAAAVGNVVFVVAATDAAVVVVVVDL